MLEDVQQDQGTWKTRTKGDRTKIPLEGPKALVRASLHREIQTQNIGRKNEAHQQLISRVHKYLKTDKPPTKPQ